MRFLILGSVLVVFDIGLLVLLQQAAKGETCGLFPCPMSVVVGC